MTIQTLFVTGATGFLGSHFVKSALCCGHHVVALTRHKRIAPPQELGQFRWLEKNLGELESSDLNGIDAIVHFSSAGVPPQLSTWEESHSHNVVDLVHLLDKARKAGILRVIICGSSFEYGYAAECHEFIPTTTSLEPVGYYASSKAAGYVAACAYAREHEMKLSYLRVFNVYGENQHSANLWPALRTAALSGNDFKMTPGGQVRDFIVVEAVMEHFLAALEDEKVQNGLPLVRNIGSGSPITVLEFAQHWWAKWEARGNLLAGALPYRPMEMMRMVPDLTVYYK